MGLIGKSFNSKIRDMATLAVSRIAMLKNQHKAIASYAYSDVAQLLNLGYHDRALLRVEHWIKEKNLLDVFVMVENYCNFLRERAELLGKNKECPDELKEATSTLIFVSSRCGEFPELHKMQELLTSNFGKEFADYAVELHKNNRVNSKMIQKLSTRRLTAEIRTKALKQIASEIGVTLNLEQEPKSNVNKLNVDQGQGEVEIKQLSSVNDPKHKEITQDETENMINKQFPLQEPHSSQNPRDNKKTSKNTKSIPNAYIEEDAIEQSNMIGELDSSKMDDNNDQKNQLDAALENYKHFIEERAQPSNQARRLNPQNSQDDHTVNPIVRRYVIGNEGGTYSLKQSHKHHEHVDWKKMSVRTR